MLATVKEIDKLRKIEKAAKDYRKFVDKTWSDCNFSHVANNDAQQVLWRALDLEDDSCDSVDMHTDTAETAKYTIKDL